MMPSNEESNNRITNTFSVSEKDTDILKWLSDQNNIDVSIYVLIKSYILQHGHGDALALLFSSNSTSQNTVPNLKHDVQRKTYNIKKIKQYAK